MKKYNSIVLCYYAMLSVNESENSLYLNEKIHFVMPELRVYLFPWADEVDLLWSEW